MQPEPPQNSGYMIAAYLITAVVLLVYWAALWRRAKRGRSSVSGT